MPPPHGGDRAAAAPPRATGRRGRTARRVTARRVAYRCAATRRGATRCGATRRATARRVPNALPSGAAGSRGGGGAAWDGAGATTGAVPPSRPRRDGRKGGAVTAATPGRCHLRERVGADGGGDAAAWRQRRWGATPAATRRAARPRRRRAPAGARAPTCRRGLPGCAWRITAGAPRVVDAKRGRAVHLRRHGRGACLGHLSCRVGLYGTANWRSDRLIGQYKRSTWQPFIGRQTLPNPFPRTLTCRPPGLA